MWPRLVSSGANWVRSAADAKAPSSAFTIRQVIWFVSGFPPALAVMPIAQQPMRQRSQQQMNCDPRHRNQEQRSKHPRNIQAKARFDNAISKPRPLAGRPCGNLSDNRADQRQSAADPEASEKIRKSGGQPEEQELVHARGPVHL